MTRNDRRGTETKYGQFCDLHHCSNITMAFAEDNGSPAATDSEDDMDWEEVDVPEVAERQNIEITLQARPKQKRDKSDKYALFGI